MLSTRRRRLLRRSMIAASCLTIAGLIASWIVAGMLVAPNPRLVGDPPPELNATAFTIQSDSGSLIGGWHGQPESSHGVIVLLHGIRSSRLSMLDRARLLHEVGYATVLIDFQAHGESPGDKITLGLLERHDVRAAVEFARSQHPNQPIGVIGVSLGGAAALLASPLDVDALVIESVYPTIDQAVHNRVAAILGPLSWVPASLLLVQLQPRLGIAPAELRPIEHLGDIDCPVYIVSGTDDQHTTESETREMFLAASEPKKLWLVDGAEHVDLLHAEPIQYPKRVVQFLQRQLRPDH